MAPLQSAEAAASGARTAARHRGGTLNKRKKVAWHKHLAKARKAKAKRKAGR
jgi:hypothetical protein